jgi:hypothetical protein
MHAYWTAMARYAPGPCAGRVTLLWPDEQSGKARPGAREARCIAAARRMQALAEHEWRGVARELDVHTIPGTHVSCVRAQIRGLAGRLTACLAITRDDP